MQFSTDDIVQKLEQANGSFLRNSVTTVFHKSQLQIFFNDIKDKARYKISKIRIFQFNSSLLT